MLCKKWKVCVHSFACACPDSLITNTIGKHIDLVKRSLMQASSDNPDDDFECPTTNSDQEHLDEIENILTCIRSRPDDADASKRRIKGTLLQIMEEMNTCNNSNALKHLEKQIGAAHSLFPSLKDKDDQKVIPLKNNEDAPADKNMETQPCFYSTKKRTKKSKVRLARPTFKEQKTFLKDISDGKVTKDVPGSVSEGTFY